MSLFESASLVVTPNGTKASKLYAIKPTDGSGDLVVTRATTATRVNSTGLIESVAVNVPRIDYTNGSCPSILLEPQRTNVVTNSNDFTSTNWADDGTTTRTANSGISPDGTQNAIKITSNGGYNYKVFPALSAGTYTYSIYMKASANTVVNITVNDIGGSGSSTKNINLTTNWQRFDITKNITLGTFVLIDYSNLISGFEYFVYGAQLEAGSYATSYIPTTSAAVTRNADVISKTGISSLIGQTEGTIYAEVKVSKLIGTASRYIFHISDGTANNRIYMAFSGSSSNVLRARIFSGGTLQCSIDTSTLTNTGTYKLALAYKNNDIVFYVNGVQIGTDTSATIPTCSRVDLGQNYANASQLGDGINNANIRKTRLTNAELISLTTL
jgi:hypothetical protein